MAKILIDIPDDEYNYFMHEEGFDVDDGLDAIEYICNGTVLNNATNGDVIKVLFPDSTIEVDGFDWWNASYKAGSEG